MTGSIESKKINLWRHKVISPDAVGQQVVYQYGASLPGIAEGIMKLGFVKGMMSQIITEGAKKINYDIPNMLIEMKAFETDVPLGFWRAVYDSQNAFANECFIDELSNLSNLDPIKLRLKHLGFNSRPAIVIKKAAKESNWGRKLKRGHFQGFAYHHSFGSHVAEVAEVSITKQNKVKVHRVTCVVDCGQTVNPMTIRAQMQGAIVFGMGATLKSEITVKNGFINQSNYDDYKVPRMHEMPRIDVHIIKNMEDPGGVGEPGLPPIAPAITNAVFAATGKRIRKLPITPNDIAA
jgi:isoquinoline 1-oxidoreductase beta subunit